MDDGDIAARPGPGKCDGGRPLCSAGGLPRGVAGRHAGPCESCGPSSFAPANYAAGAQAAGTPETLRVGKWSETGCQRGLRRSRSGVRSPACHAIAIWRRRATALFRRGLPRRGGGPSCRPVRELRPVFVRAGELRRGSPGRRHSKERLAALGIQSCEDHRSRPRPAGLGLSAANMGIARVAHGARVRCRGAGTAQDFCQTPSRRSPVVGRRSWVVGRGSCGAGGLRR